jgi:hypothetical protein
VLDTKAAKDAPLQALNGLYKRFNLAEKTAREYIKLFGDCYLPKETRLVEDLLKIWDGGYFERGGRGWTIDKENVARCITIVCNNQPMLKGGHEYLKQIMKVHALQTSRREERDKHDRAQSRPRTKDQGMAPVAAALPEITDAERAEMKAQIKRDKEKLFGKKGGTAVEHMG